MFNSTVLEVAIGLVFCFAAVAMMVSSLTEALASILKWRAHSLLSGVKELVNDPNLAGLARELYDHALVNPRGDGRAQNEAALKTLPSYIQPQHFAEALLDCLRVAPAQAAGSIESIADPQLRALLAGMYARAQGDMGAVREALAGWFDAGMARVSGAYKRRAQLVSFLIALALAGALNIDAIHLCQTLWEHPALVAAFASAGAVDTQGELFARLAQAPIGWTTPWFEAGWPTLSMLTGWFITATASLFGAPFWFDLLQKLVRLRGTGATPPAR